MSSESPLIQIVDERDQPLRGGTMDEVQLQGLWHRMVGVMIYSSQQGFLLQRVPQNPYYDGGKWNLTATGHVDVGETYDEAAARELAEEMGITELRPVKVDYYQTELIISDRTYRRFNQIFIGETNEHVAIHPAPDEVAETRWCTAAELAQLVGDPTSQVNDMLQRFITKLSHDKRYSG